MDGLSSMVLSIVLCSIEDLPHLIKQRNAKLAKSITLTITSQYKDINLSFNNSNTSYGDITRQNV